MAKQSVRKVDAIALQSGLYRCTYADGVTLERDFKFLFPDWDELTTVQKYVVGYGVKQRVADVQASLSGELESVMREKAEAVFDGWMSGEVSFRGEGDGAGGISIAVRAWAHVHGIDTKAAVEAWNAIIEKNLARNPNASKRAIHAAVTKFMRESNQAFDAAYTTFQRERDERSAGKVEVVIE